MRRFSRREILGGATGALVVGGAAIASRPSDPGRSARPTPDGAPLPKGADGTRSSLQPAVFISHGSPMVALESDEYTDALAKFGAANRPSAVAVISAHWEAPGPIRVTSVDNPPLVYDFGGFPDALYRVRYPAPGSPDLAAEIEDSLSASGHPATLDPSRGLDHGVWVPLLRLFPEANVPTVAISLPRPRSPEQLFEIGRSLAPLRHKGVMLVGSGGIVHNLRMLVRQKDAPTIDWAARFDDWVAERLERDPASLLRYHEAPHASWAVPTTEHFDPLFAILGASGADKPPSSIHTGFHHGSLSMRSFAFPG